MVTRNRIIPDDKLDEHIRTLREAGKRLVFANGCFDLLHPGHVQLLEHAAEQGVLIVGVNSDASVRSFKSLQRPIVSEDERCLMLASLRCVDYVVMFEADRPMELLQRIQPDVYVRGGESEETQETRLAEELGAEVLYAPYLAGVSTTEIIARVAHRVCGDN